VTDTSARSFDAAFGAVAHVEGWMTEDQAKLLWQEASRCTAGDQIVEIGSFRGRSAVILARAAPGGVAVVAIDPHLGTDRGPQEITTTAQLGQSDHEAFTANLAAAGVAERVRHVRELSSAAHDQVTGAVDLLYIDGAHRYGPARADIVQWGGRVREGGTLLIHDSWSSIGVTLALLTTLVWSADWTYVGRAQSMTQYRRVPVRGRGRTKNVVRQLAELPWFARNVVIKALMVARLGRLTRLLGHDGETWPY
jgi:predicted O-methyltransferase YrrM